MEHRFVQAFWGIMRDKKAARRFAMSSSRREFLRAALSGAVVLTLAGKGLPSDVFTSPASILPRDHDLLDDLQRAAFEYFWNEADPNTGLIRDRANANGGDLRTTSSIAATGFGLTALCIGHKRGYRSPDQITTRVRNTLQFLANEAPNVSGFLYHFVDMRTGERSRVSEISPIDMAILLCGALTCRQYFQDEQIILNATQLYERVEWPWALNNADTFAMQWTPEFGFGKYRWSSYCESMMLYLLAIGSPTHPIAPECWDAIRRPRITYRGYHFISSRAPLFIHQFSHAWFDFRNRQDTHADYFENSVTASKAHREFCTELSAKFPCYSEDVWGITASDSCRGYVAWGGPPIQGPIDGTIVPAASAGSLPFIYDECQSVLKNLRSSFGKQIWKRYGFVDAFNPLTGWVSSDVIGIDVGISMLMAENARTQFVWNTFMQNLEPNLAMARCGFRSDPAPQST
ncbi:MAG TPA: glucoamylase family protein [Terriglobales bacterium]|nr:glucoamylase family protein [Terriglobales bacterium]